jgi:D-3-phosphoglycerate dehydrogenase/(S)-sulfolactate dehydrogenase
MSTPERKPVVCVLDEVHPAVFATLAASAEVLRPTDGAAERWVAEADAVIVRNSRITAEAIAAARHLKVIGKHGAGTDNIDSEAARKAGVEILTTPGLNAESVADLAVGMALALIRNIHGHTQALKHGRPLEGAARVGFEISELPVGIIGFGAVGRAVAHRLQRGFGATITAFDPGISDEDWPEEAKRSRDLKSLLRTSMLVFLHLPLVEETLGLIGEEALSAMPEGSFLVNCARGGIVDEHALAQALRSGHLAGAAADVFVIEPPLPSNPLLAIDSFLATPHLGASTNRGLERVGVGIAEKVIASLGQTRRAM